MSRERLTVDCGTPELRPAQSEAADLPERRAQVAARGRALVRSSLSTLLDRIGRVSCWRALAPDLDEREFAAALWDCSWALWSELTRSAVGDDGQFELIDHALVATERIATAIEMVDRCPDTAEKLLCRAEQALYRAAIFELSQARSREPERRHARAHAARVASAQP